MYFADYGAILKNYTIGEIMEINKIAVIGAGSGGLAMAGHLSLMGFEVNLYNRGQERINLIQKMGGVNVTGIFSGFAHLRTITTNIKKAIKSADLIMVAIPASGHGDLATICSSHLEYGQIVILNPGRTFGALEFSKIIEKNNADNDITIAEAQTIIYTSRSRQFGDVEILALKNKVPMASLPAKSIDKLIDTIKPIYPQFVPAANVFETSLNNIGAIFHPAPTLLNVGWIESPNNVFKYYYEAITPTISQFLELVDRERLSLAEVLGVEAISAKDWLYEAYGAKGKNLYEALQNNDKYRTIDAPTSLMHRYIFEDIPTGLVPMASFGSAFGVDMPNINMLIKLASVLTGANFWETGRTIEKLGFKGMSIRQIIDIVER